MNIKELIKAQIKNENRHAKQNSTKYMGIFLKDFENYIKDAITNLELYLYGFKPEDYQYTVKGEPKIREDLVEIHSVLKTKDFEQLYLKLLTLVVPKETVTLQQAVGSIIGSFSEIEMMSRKLKACNIILKFCPLVEIAIIKGAERGYIHSLITLDKEEKDILNQQSVVLPSIAPLRTIKNNSSIGYRTFRKSAIMGGKHHDKPINLNHLNKRNKVTFCIDPEVAGRVVMGKLGNFDPTPKYNKKTDKLETATEVQERKAAWHDLHADLHQKIKAIAGKPIWFSHRRDNRGRTYCEAYHINYQGVDWQKALISLHKQEVAEGDW
ncbi:DNA-dependent RNA polymerase [Vibrio phage vB_VhaP_PG11]|nr:DNA-dependent RNA polymerase [Vibrio phage vB_VhaP_PG11]